MRRCPIDPAPARCVVGGAALLAAMALLAAPLELALGGDLPTGSGPQRIITIGPNAAEIICGLGACDRIVAVDKFCVHPPELLDRPRIGGLFDPDLEKIVTLRPDLVVVRGHSQSVTNLCNQLKVTIHLDRTEKLADIVTCIKELARILGLQASGSAMVEEFERRLNAIRKRVAGRPRPRVLLTISRRPDRIANVLTSGKGTFLDEMIEIAGGVNVFGHLDMAYPQVSVESIVARRPEVIIELLPELKMTEAMQRQMRAQWKQLGSIPAALKGQIWFVTDDNALIPSPRCVEIIDKISRILHPGDKGE